MRILLDECVNPRVKDGKLMALAQQSFDVFLTVDRNLEYQQNLAKLTLGLVVVTVPDNNIKYFKPMFPELLTAVESVRAGQVIHIGSPNLKA
jgi:hypothetical protein